METHQSVQKLLYAHTDSLIFLQASFPFLKEAKIITYFVSVLPHGSQGREKPCMVHSSGRVLEGKEQTSVLLLQNWELQQLW
jgi:hypothetical protein